VEIVTPTHCLDACAVIAYLRKESGSEVLKEIIERSNTQRVGVIKVEERVSFADAFALALAERLSAPLVTTDHHEFDAVEQKGHFRFLWLR
jgi:predicted nucleic acid-binding protein